MILRSLTLFIIASTALAVGGCASESTQATSTGADKSAVTTLGITNSPITSEQARTIAAETLHGTALSVETSDEKGDPAYEVKVDVAGVIKEVQVRISDGAVTRVETDDDQGGDDDDDHDDEGSDSDED